MIPVSIDYRRQLIAGNRNWLIKVPVYLNGNVSGTPDFTLTNEHIWDNGIVLDNAISSDSSFDLGAAIVGSLKVIIDNIDGNYSTYDFYDARLWLYLGVEGDVDEHDVQVYYNIGHYVVDEPSYNGSLITLNCLDNMTWFDIPFDEVTGITYPATAGTVVQAMCTYVGVTLATPQFPNYADNNTRLLAAPEQKINCREVLQYIAQMCCCYCKIDRYGQLNLRWHDKQQIIGIKDWDGGSFSTLTTPYSDGCNRDGGSFNPWNQGDDANGGLFTDLLNRAFISQNYQIEVSTDDVVITGCRVRNNTSKEDEAYDYLWVDANVEALHPRYVLVIENNPFVTKTTAQNIANIVGSTLAGLPVRGFTATSLADFSIETGDMATVVDFRGNRYYTWLTHFVFTTNNSEQFSCGVESLRKRSEERYSSAIKTLAEADANASSRISDYDRAVQAMNDLGQAALSYYKYQYGGQTWLHNGATIDTTDPNNPKFPYSTVVFKISGAGVFIAKGSDIHQPDGTCTFSNGYDANSGTAILNMIYAHGINCDWIKSGTLTLGGNNNVNGWMQILNSAGAWCATYDVNGINVNNVFKVNAVGRLDTSDFHVSSGEITGALTMGANGSIGFESSSLDSFTAKLGGFSVKHQVGSKFGAIAYGSKAVDYAAQTGVTWTGREFIYWNGSDNANDGGLCVATGSPTDANSLANLLVLHHGKMVLYEGYGHDVATFDEYHYDIWNGQSDRRVKKNIKDVLVEDSLNILKKLRPRSFKFNKKSKQDNTKTHIGFIAQEVQDIDGINDGMVSQDCDYLVINYREIIPHLVNVVNKQQEEIDLLKQEIALLKEKVGV